MSLLAGLREIRAIGAVARELESERERGLVLKDVTAALVACAKALILDIEDLGARRVHESLDQTLARVRAEAPPDAVAAEADRTRRETLVYANEERRYLAERDAELKRIIALLTDGLAALGEGNASHNRRLLDNGARLEAVSQLGDIVKMRRAIADEVRELRSAVAEKQAADAARSAELDREVSSLRKDLESARTAATTDPLTGAANRAAFQDELTRLADIAAAGGEGFALVMFDIDKFKDVNDTYGHAVGDRVLMAFAAFCRENVRRGDVVARWGGEEIAVLLPSASLRAAHAKAQRMIKTLARRSWSIDGAQKVTFTASAGVAAWTRGDTPDKMVERADQALYAAKRGGRNRAAKGPT
jgi:diguanylate cyclase